MHVCLYVMFCTMQPQILQTLSACLVAGNHPYREGRKDKGGGEGSKSMWKMVCEEERWCVKRWYVSMYVCMYVCMYVWAASTLFFPTSGGGGVCVMMAENGGKGTWPHERSKETSRNAKNILQKCRT